MRHTATSIAILCTLVFTGCPGEKKLAPPPSEAIDASALAASAKATFGPLPTEVASDTNPITDAKVKLGKLLYFDARFSKNQDISCNTCHDLATAGVDNKPTSPGHKGQLGTRNSPTVLNAALQASQFWDGRAATVEEQAIGPILNPVEMGMADEDAVLKVIKSIPGYSELFKEAFPGEGESLTYVNVGMAIGAFERRLMTPGAFDKFIGGDHAALDAEQQRGLKLFMETGCIACHMGPNFGGSTIMKLGLIKPYETKDLGRYEVTKKEEDKYFFKSSPLRNVTRTGPYLHDGSVAELGAVVKLMAEYQLGKTLEDKDVTSIVAFLKSLEGDPPADLAKPPEALPSGPDTPKPDPS